MGSDLLMLICFAGKHAPSSVRPLMINPYARFRLSLHGKLMGRHCLLFLMITETYRRMRVLVTISKLSIVYFVRLFPLCKVYAHPVILRAVSYVGLRTGKTFLAASLKDSLLSRVSLSRESPLGKNNSRSSTPQVPSNVWVCNVNLKPINMDFLRL